MSVTREKQEVNLEFSATLFSTLVMGDEPADCGRDDIELNEFTIGNQDWDPAKVREWLARRFPKMATSKPSYETVLWSFIEEIADAHSDSGEWSST